MAQTSAPQPDLSLGFQEIAGCAPALIWVSNAETQGVWFNRTWLEYTGAQLPGRTRGRVARPNSVLRKLFGVGDLFDVVDRTLRSAQRQL